MDPGRALFADCDAAVRRHLGSDERVLAIGRCEDISEIGGVERGGIAGDYVMVTSQKVRWVPGYRLALEASLDLAAVTAFTERTLAHRYAICLQHPGVERRRLDPGARLPVELQDQLRAEGRLRDDRTPLTYTEFAFSRRDTAVARALRGSLRSRLGL